MSAPHAPWLRCFPPRLGLFSTCCCRLPPPSSRLHLSHRGCSASVAVAGLQPCVPRAASVHKAVVPVVHPRHRSAVCGVCSQRESSVRQTRLGVRRPQFTTEQKSLALSTPRSPCPHVCPQACVTSLEREHCGPSGRNEKDVPGGSSLQKDSVLQGEPWGSAGRLGGWGRVPARGRPGSASRGVNGTRSAEQETAPFCTHTAGPAGGLVYSLLFLNSELTSIKQRQGVY